MKVARRVSAATLACLCLVAGAAVTGGTAQAVPPVGLLGAATVPVLSSNVVLRGEHSASVDVMAASAFTISPASFDPPSSVFYASRRGSGFALVALGGGKYPAGLIGVMAPEGRRSRALFFPFGDDGRGNDVLVSLQFPAGRYRLTLFTDGPTTVSFALGTQRAGTLNVQPRRQERVVVQNLTAPGTTVLGSVLGAAAPTGLAANNLLIQTVAGRLDVSAAGYESYWCAYAGTPPLGYLPRCIGGEGVGVARVGPLVGFDYSGINVFVGVPGPSSGAFSRSLSGVGQIVDQSSEFVWLPLPTSPEDRAAPPALGYAADNIVGRSRCCRLSPYPPSFEPVPARLGCRSC